jgi:class 3 adenylate cyclase
LDLTPGNSRRQDAISVYADIDGFTKYVGSSIDDNAEDVVRTLHVVRAELERVLSSRFGGRRIRFIGDCLHGLLCEGTSQTTNDEETVSAATLLAGALRSSFELTLERLQANGFETGDIGLAIGFEFGPMTITRLGIQGSRVRCSISRGVLASEIRQADCKGNETAIGEEAYKVASSAIRELFGKDRKVSDLDYNEAVEALSEKDDETAKASQQRAYEHAPYIARAAETQVRPHTESVVH